MILMIGPHKYSPTNLEYHSKFVNDVSFSIASSNPFIVLILAEPDVLNGQGGYGQPK